MKSITFPVIILLISISLKSYCQINDFKDVLTKPVIGKKVIIKKDSSIESNRTFLGTVKDRKGDIVFYVVKEFYTVQAAIEKHGHSRLLLFDKGKNLLAIYDFDLPEELPYQLKKNILYFKFSDKGVQHNKIYTDTVGTSVPKCICVESDDCYFANE